jgi:hypothetical protein
MARPVEGFGRSLWNVLLRRAIVEEFAVKRD